MNPAAPTKKAEPIRLSAADRVRRLVRVHTPSHTASALEQVWLDGQDLELGREPGTEGWVVSDDQASRRHARLEFNGQGYLLKDLGATNHTFLDGRRLESPSPLADNAVIRVGETLFVYEDQEAPSTLDRTVTSPAKGLTLHNVERLAARAATAALPSRRGLAPVMILGPTGAGKERIARLVHDASGRAGAFVAFNCGGALQRELTWSALFGHRKGAFTGATADRAGAFQRASGGTVFLDEIGELPLELQPLLLRALQEGRIQPQGADQDFDVDTRVVVATHRDLRAAVSAGAFREDLFARLAFVPLEIPGLQRRRVEILPLLRRFARQTLNFTELTAEALVLADWPQNIRALEALAVQLGLHASDDEAVAVTRAMLPVDVRDSVPAPTTRASRGPTKVELEGLLKKHKGNVAAVAAELGTHRAQVYRWLDAFHLEPKDSRPKGRRQ